MLLQKILDAVFPNQWLVLEKWDGMTKGDKFGIYDITRVNIKDPNNFSKYSPEIILAGYEDTPYVILQYQETFSGSYLEPPSGDYNEIGSEHKEIGFDMYLELVQLLVSEVVHNVVEQDEIESAYNESNEIPG